MYLISRENSFVKIMDIMMVGMMFMVSSFII